MMKKILVVFLFIITSCGYQPLYKIDNNKNNFKIKEFQLSGDKNLGKKIFQRLSLEIIKSDESLDKLIIDSQKSIVETSKNLKGQTTSYRSSIQIKLSILDNEDDVIKKKIFSKEFLYNTKNNKFRLKEYQTEIENNLINKIIEDINIYLSF
jgi:hypothetical protein